MRGDCQIKTFSPTPTTYRHCGRSIILPSLSASEGPAGATGGCPSLALRLGHVSFLPARSTMRTGSPSIVGCMLELVAALVFSAQGARRLDETWAEVLLL